MKCRLRCSAEACFLRAADGHHSVQQVAGSLAGMQIPGHRDRPPSSPRIPSEKNRRRNQFSESQNCSEFQAVQIPDTEKPLQKVPHRSCSDTELPCRCTPTVCQRHGMSANVCVGVSAKPISGTGAADSQKHSTSQIQKKDVTMSPPVQFPLDDCARTAILLFQRHRFSAKRDN